jgi:hypothetical protein
MFDDCKQVRFQHHIWPAILTNRMNLILFRHRLRSRFCRVFPSTRKRYKCAILRIVPRFEATRRSSLRQWQAPAERRQLPRGPRRDSQRDGWWKRARTAALTPIIIVGSFSSFNQRVAFPLSLSLSLSLFFSLTRNHVPLQPPFRNGLASRYYVTIKSSRFSGTVSYCTCRIKFWDRAWFPK